MKYLLGSLLACGLLSCGSPESSKSDKELTSNDFESVNGWMNGAATPSLTKERAHSGVYAVKVDPTTEYSLGYNNQLGKLSAVRIAKVKIRAWVNLPTENTPVTLVVELKNPGEPKPALWESLDLLTEAKAKGLNQWIEVEKTVDLPASAAYTSQLGVYLWRGSSSQPAYLDDLQILRAD